jgi:hypothetical protein
MAPGRSIRSTLSRFVSVSRSSIPGKISHHWEESSKVSNAERIQTRRKTWRSPAGYAQQEDGPRKRSLRCCDFQAGSIATRFSVGSHEIFVDTARLADKGRSGGTPLRPQQTGTRSSDRSSSNGQTHIEGGPIVTRCRMPSTLFVEEIMIVAGSKGPRPAQKAKCIKTLALTSRMDEAQSTSGRQRPRSEDPVRTH